MVKGKTSDIRGLEYGRSVTCLTQLTARAWNASVQDSEAKHSNSMRFIPSAAATSTKWPSNGSFTFSTDKLTKPHTSLGGLVNFPHASAVGSHFSDMWSTLHLKIKTNDQTGTSSGTILIWSSKELWDTQASIKPMLCTALFTHHQSDGWISVMNG